MRLNIGVVVFVLMLTSVRILVAAEDPSSMGAKAGEAARELKETADESLSTGAMKVAETSQKVEVEVQDTLRTLQQQWDEFTARLQEKTRQIQKQLQQQLRDFNKSFNAPKT